MTGVYKSTPSEAAKRLADYMSDLSEEAFSARWLMRLEYLLWAEITEPADDSLVGLSAEEIDRLTTLANECSGWIMWDNSAEGVIWVPTQIWEMLYRQHKSQSSMEHGAESATAPAQGNLIAKQLQAILELVELLETTAAEISRMRWAFDSKDNRYQDCVSHADDLAQRANKYRAEYL